MEGFTVAISQIFYPKGAPKKEEFFVKLERWKQEKTNEERDDVARYMEQSYKNKEQIIILYKRNISTFPPMYPEANRVIVVDSPNLFGAPLIHTQIYGKRMVSYGDKYLYENCSDNLGYIGQPTPLYIQEVDEWWIAGSSQETRSKVANYLQQEYDSDHDVIFLCGLNITEYPPMSDKVACVVVEDCPGLLDASLDKIKTAGRKVIHLSELEYKEL